MQFSHIYEVDISRAVQPVPLQQMLVQGDRKANRIGVRLKNGASIVTPTGACAGTALRTDGKTVPLYGEIDSTEHVMYVELPAEAYAVEGNITISITAASGDTLCTPFVGYGTVIRTQSGVVIEPGAVLPSIPNLMIAIQQAVQLMRASGVILSKAGVGSVAIPDAAAGVGMDVSVTIPPAQEAGTPSLDNVLPFSLRDSVTIADAGASASGSVAVNLPSGADPFTGGVLRVDPSGKAHLSRTWHYYEFDGTEAWTLVNGSGGNPKLLRCQYDKNNNRFPQVTSVSSTRCTALPYGAALTTNDNTGIYAYKSGNNTYPYIHVRLDDMSGVTADSWQATLAALYAAGTPLAINYRRATPAVQEWDADTVVAFGGQNALSSTPANIGVTVTYTADAKEYADRIAGNFAPAEKWTAESAHAPGEMFLIENVLYRAKEAIAQGDTLTAGENGNIEQAKVSESLLPAAPTADGTYALTVTVSDGVPTYSWTAQS